MSIRRYETWAWCCDWCYTTSEHVRTLHALPDESDMQARGWRIDPEYALCQVCAERSD